MSENVLVVPTVLFHECGKFDGFLPETDVDKYASLFDPANQKFLPRDEVEDDPAWKQLIPYVLVRQCGLFGTYIRGRDSEETRLHALHSIGIGGHISSIDFIEGAIAELHMERPHPMLNDVYMAGMLRELSEELDLHIPVHSGLVMPLLGMVNDDSTDVGSVHLGVVHVLELAPASRVVARSEDICNLIFTTLASLRQVSRAGTTKFEPWSQICLDHAFPKKAQQRKPKTGK